MKNSQQDPLHLARHYENEFWSDMAALHVRPPNAVVRVTEHLDVICNYIAQIERNGLAYRTANGVYFDVTEFSKRYMNKEGVLYHGSPFSHVSRVPSFDIGATGLSTGSSVRKKWCKELLSTKEEEEEEEANIPLWG